MTQLIRQAGPPSSPVAFSRLGGFAARGLAGLAVLIGVASAALLVGPMLLPFQPLVVVSGSMEPTILAGSLIFVTPVDAQLVQAGDIIAFERPGVPGELVTHRVDRIEDDDAGTRAFVTRGDANTDVDGWRISASGNGSRYAFGLPLAGHAVLAAKAPFGRLILLVIPAIGLGALLLLETWWPRRPEHQATA